MPPPKRRHPSRPSAPPPAPLEPLGVIVREYDNWRRGQSGKPGKGALREYWRQRDAKQGQRPDYLLWRLTQCVESPPEKRQDPVDAALRALRAQDANIQWAGLALAPALLESRPPLNPARREEVINAMLGRLGGQGQRPLPPLAACPQSSALVAWLARAMIEPSPSLLKSLADLLLATRPEWKPGRGAELEFLKTEAWMPVPRGQVVRSVVKAITRIIGVTMSDAAPNSMLSPQDAVAWHLTAWMLLRDSRPPQSTPRPEELEVLLDAAATARIAGDAHEAARLTALALNLASPQMPEALLQRCRVAAWTLAEAGLSVPQGLRVALEDLPFPGEPPASEKGQEAAKLFYDAADMSRQALAKEVLEDADWQRLRTAGVALHHPLAALAWIGKKAQSYVVKKQQDLLQTAATLAARHHCLTTWGKILAQSPGSAESVLAYAQAMRQSLRRMPVLRDSETWQEWTNNLRVAWGRLDTDVIHDPEAIFMLHETLVDREVTSLRCLPQDLRVLALRHLHSRRSPSVLVQALEEDPRLMQSLVHQRSVELWSIASELRERPEQAGAVWVSLAARGDAASGKYSLLVQGASGRVQLQGRLRSEAAAGWDYLPLLKEITGAVARVSASPEWLLLALDATFAATPLTGMLHQSGLTASIALIPSFEWAFRVLRTAPSPEKILEVLAPEAAAPASNSETLSANSGPGMHACLLLAGADASDGSTRWSVVNAPKTGDEKTPTRRSISIGAFPLIVSFGPLKSQELSADLIRLSLAHSARCLIAPTMAFSPETRAALENAVVKPEPRVPFAERLRTLSSQGADRLQINGLPWFLD